MRFAVAVAALSSIGFAAAASSAAAAPSSSACQAQNIVDACKVTIMNQVNACGQNDWICMCDQYTNLLTCYNNCPDSAEKPPVQNQVTQFCNAAAPLKSSSLAALSTRPVASIATSAAATSAAGTASGVVATGFGSATATGANAKKTGAAGQIAAPVGGLLAVMFGVAGFL
ncbi:hypothetical protein BCR34DRAFT_600794 [Clohesyomyces aquaticus]|uniref:GPI anchored serine-threonine rich protein n=1 Tax=Clohesyomyces aquaticus TaxID=1231657 RepID=A0A1Y1ZPS4_9PLEO|nr:hypothetical protein BCR34DRAFT_600794 [Clohesyomyces aquaticus]